MPIKNEIKVKNVNKLNLALSLLAEPTAFNTYTGTGYTIRTDIYDGLIIVYNGGRADIYNNSGYKVDLSILVEEILKE